MQNIFVIGLCFQKRTVGFQLLRIHNGFGFCLGRVFQNILPAVALQFTECAEQVGRCFRQLSAGQFMCNRLRTRFAFLPVVRIVSDKMGGGGVPEFTGKMLCQHLCLSDIRVVAGFVGNIRIVSLRRDISVLPADTVKEFLRRVPDGCELFAVKRRFAFCRLLQKGTVCFVGIAVLLDDTAGKAGEGSIAAAFPYDGGHIAGRHICVKIVLKKRGQIELTFIQFHFGTGCTEKEAGGIKCIGVKIGEDGADEFFHIAVSDGIRHRFNRKKDMELRSCRFSVFLPHMGTAVVNGECNTGKSCLDICRHDPVAWVLGVVVVAVNRQTVGSDEVVVAPVTVPVFRTDIVVSDRRTEAVQIGNGVSVRIVAVARIAGIVGTVECEHQSLTSSRLAVKCRTVSRRCLARSSSICIPSVTVSPNHQISQQSSRNTLPIRIPRRRSASFSSERKRGKKRCGANGM